MSSLAQAAADHLIKSIGGRIPDAGDTNTVTNAPGVTILDHPGAFDGEEIDRLSDQFPAIYVSVIGTAEAEQMGGLVISPVRFVCNIFAHGPGKRRLAGHITRGDQCEAMALGVITALTQWGRIQDVDPVAATLPAPAYHLAANLGKPVVGGAVNLYDSGNDGEGIAWWRVQFEAPFTHAAASDVSLLNTWDLLHSTYPKDDWREGVASDVADVDLKNETDLT